MNEMRKASLTLALVLSTILTFGQSKDVPEFLKGVDYFLSTNESGDVAYNLCDASVYPELKKIPLKETITYEDGDVVEIRETEDIFVWIHKAEGRDDLLLIQVIPY